MIQRPIRLRRRARRRREVSPRPGQTQQIARFEVGNTRLRSVQALQLTYRPPLALSAFAQERGLRVIAFNPGFTPGTQLIRNHPLAFKLPFAVLVPILKLFPAHEYHRRWWRSSGGYRARPDRPASGAALCLAGQALPDVAGSFRIGQ